MHRNIARPAALLPDRTGRARTGATLVEIAIAMGLMVLAIGGFSRALSATITTVDQQSESSRALEAARRTIERLQSTPFEEVFARFSAGAGASFAVEGLQAVDGDEDGLPGEIVFPTLEVGGVLELREDLDLPLLGMPRDLNGDGLIDGEDHSAVHDLLPVLVRVRWRGAAGDARVELHTLLADFGG